MSRHWSEYKYISTEDLWSFIDEQSQKLDLLATQDTVESSELCKLLIMGRREMIDVIACYLSDNETPLKQVVVDQHEVITEDEYREIIKQEFDV